ncbi:MAG TPA: NlpC/P60 family protein [Roseiarcus sp.]|nr:NlpC/P60 family protein [Roseiarcus sp.]
MTRAYDPRLTPARPDLAAAHLRGVVDAPRYADGRTMQVIEASAPLRRWPAPDAPLETEALFGEAVMVYDEAEGWVWAQLDRDLYVGYLPRAALGAPTEPTHRVSALRTHAYPGPSIKLPPRIALSLGARLTIAQQEKDFAASAGGLWLWRRHLTDVGLGEADFVAVAELFVETPYLWGGRTSEGIDCSGLAQTALTAAGIAAPRDSDMLAALGEPVAINGPIPLMRGDLVFWKGHVGIMRDAQTLLHANGFHMKVVSEPLGEARARIATADGGEVTSVRRLARFHLASLARRGLG